MAEKRRREKEGDRDPDHEFSFEELFDDDWSDDGSIDARNSSDDSSDGERGDATHALVELGNATESEESASEEESPVDAKYDATLEFPNKKAVKKWATEAARRIGHKSIVKDKTSNATRLEHKCHATCDYAMNAKRIVKDGADVWRVRVRFHDSTIGIPNARGQEPTATQIAHGKPAHTASVPIHRLTQRLAGAAPPKRVQNPQNRTDTRQRQRALAAKNDGLCGVYERSVKLLPLLKEAIESIPSAGKDANSLVEIFTDDNDTSVYAGVLLVHGPALHTASKANLPAVFTDFCQVAKKRPGAIVVATCQDAGMRTFPLAVGHFVANEGAETWDRTISTLKTAFDSLGAVPTFMVDGAGKSPCERAGVRHRRCVWRRIATSRKPRRALNRGTIGHRPHVVPTHDAIAVVTSPRHTPRKSNRRRSHGAPSGARGAGDDGSISSAHPRRAGSSSRGRSRTAPLKLPPPKKCRPFSFLGQKMPTFVVLSQKNGLERRVAPLNKQTEGATRTQEFVGCSVVIATQMLRYLQQHQ